MFIYSYFYDQIEDNDIIHVNQVINLKNVMFFYKEDDLNCPSIIFYMSNGDELEWFYYIEEERDQEFRRLLELIEEQNAK